MDWRRSRSSRPEPHRHSHLPLACVFVVSFSVLCETSSLLDLFKRATTTTTTPSSPSSQVQPSGSSDSLPLRRNSQSFFPKSDPDYNRYTWSQSEGQQEMEFVPIAPPSVASGQQGSKQENETLPLSAPVVLQANETLSRRLASSEHQPPSQKYNHHYNYPMKSDPFQGLEDPRVPRHPGGKQAVKSIQDQFSNTFFDTAQFQGPHIQPHYKDPKGSPQQHHHASSSASYSSSSSHSNKGHAVPAGHKTHGVQARGWGGGWGGGWGWGHHHDSNLDLYSLLGGLGFASLLGATLLYLARMNNGGTTVTVNASGRRRKRSTESENDFEGGMTTAEFLAHVAKSLTEPWWTVTGSGGSERIHSEEPTSILLPA